MKKEILNTEEGVEKLMLPAVSRKERVQRVNNIIKEISRRGLQSAKNNINKS